MLSVSSTGVRLRKLRMESAFIMDCLYDFGHVTAPQFSHLQKEHISQDG